MNFCPTPTQTHSRTCNKIKNKLFCVTPITRGPVFSGGANTYASHDCCRWPNSPPNLCTQTLRSRSREHAGLYACGFACVCVGGQVSAADPTHITHTHTQMHTKFAPKTEHCTRGPRNWVDFGSATHATEPAAARSYTAPVSGRAYLCVLYITGNLRPLRPIVLRCSGCICTRAALCYSPESASRRGRSYIRRGRRARRLYGLVVRRVCTTRSNSAVGGTLQQWSPVNHTWIGNQYAHTGIFSWVWARAWIC